jgi:hypothetical protein
VTANSSEPIPVQLLDEPADPVGGSTSFQEAPTASPTKTRLFAAVSTLQGEMQMIQRDMEASFKACMGAIRDLTKVLKDELEIANIERRAHEDTAQRIKELHEKFILGEMEDPSDMLGWEDLV